MDVLGKLCTLEGNDEVIEAGLEPETYESLIRVLIASDVQVITEGPTSILFMYCFNEQVNNSFICTRSEKNYNNLLY